MLNMNFPSEELVFKLKLVFYRKKRVKVEKTSPMSQGSLEILRVFGGSKGI